MNGKVNWGILGCAGIAARSLIPAIAQTTNGVLYGIASREPARARAWAKKHGFIQAYGGYGDLLDDDAIDAVYIPLPNNLHAEWAIEAANSGKHILCEKPMAMNAPEARKMIEAARASGVHLAEAFMYKFHPQMDKLLRLVQAGEIGELRSIHSTFTFLYKDDGSNYRWSPEMGGGALYDVGCYTISAARLVFGEEPVSVYARSSTHPERRVDVSFHMMLEFPDGRFALCDCGFDSQFQSRLRVVGELGAFGLDWAFSAKDFDTEILVAQGDRRSEITVPKANMYTRMVEDFASAVLDGRPPRFPADDAERNMRVIDACFESCRTGHRSGL